MEAKDTQLIVNEILAQIRKEGSSIGKWYVGVTSDVEKMLFREHNVSKEEARFCYHKAFNSDDAGYVGKVLVDCGCDGGSGGEAAAVFVYAYLKTESTKP